MNANSTQQNIANAYNKMDVRRTLIAAANTALQEIQQN